MSSKLQGGSTELTFVKIINKSLDEKWLRDSQEEHGITRHIKCTHKGSTIPTQRQPNCLPQFVVVVNF